MPVTPYLRRMIVGGGADTTIVAQMNPADTSFTLTNHTGWPDGSTGNWWCEVEPNTTNSEKILCGAQTAGAVTIVQRNGDGGNGTGLTHPAGVPVRLIGSAQDLDEANQAVVQTIGKVITAGDMLIGSGANALQRVAAPAKGGLWVSTGVGAAPVWLAAGTDGQVLIADSTQADGVRWGAVGPTSAWTTYTPTIGGTGWALGNGSISGRYRQIDAKTLGIQIYFVMGSTTTVGSGLLTFSLPPTMSAFAPASSSQTVQGWLDGPLLQLAVGLVAWDAPTNIRPMTTSGSTLGGFGSAAIVPSATQEIGLNGVIEIQ